MPDLSSTHTSAPHRRHLYAELYNVIACTQNTKSPLGTITAKVHRNAQSENAMTAGTL